VTTLATTADVADESAVRRATALVIVVLGLVAVSEAGYGAASGGLGEVPVVAALVVLPLLYVIPATRPLWRRHRYLLLGLQAVLTYAPFALFGLNWTPSGWLAGLVLVTVPYPASWFTAAILAACSAAVWALSDQLTTPGAVWAVIAFAFDALVMFGLSRLADLVAAVHAARDELAEAAVTAERVKAANSLRAAIGDRLAEAAGRSAAALQAIAGNPAHAREQTAETAAVARQALDEVREVTARYRDAPGPEPFPAKSGGLLAPRLAQAVLMATLCGLAVFYALDVVKNIHGVPGGYSAPVVAGTIAVAVALVILQLRHSWPSRGIARPRGWPVTLLLQAVLTYALIPATGWHPLIMSGFLAGSALLLLPATLGRVAFAAVIGSVPVLWAVKPITEPRLTPVESLDAMLFLTVDSAALGLLVYGLTRLAQLAVQLEGLRGELAREAVASERLRVAQDTHDLLGLGLSAIAMKADLIGKLIGRDNTRAGEEIAELARICTTARADVRLVAGEARDLPLDAELAAARDVLASAGIDVRMRVRADPPPEAAAVLVPVAREAVTNILKHSSARCCTLELTAHTGQLRLSISNDGSDDRGDAGGAPPAGDGRAGNGLRNLAARLEAAGGRLAVGGEDGTFSLMAELPLVESQPAV